MNKWSGRLFDRMLGVAIVICIVLVIVLFTINRFPSLTAVVIALVASVVIFFFVFRPW